MSFYTSLPHPTHEYQAVEYYHETSTANVPTEIVEHPFYDGVFLSENTGNADHSFQPHQSPVTTERCALVPARFKDITFLLAGGVVAASLAGFFIHILSGISSILVIGIILMVLALVQVVLSYLQSIPKSILLIFGVIHTMLLMVPSIVRIAGKFDQVIVSGPIFAFIIVAVSSITAEVGWILAVLSRPGIIFSLKPQNPSEAAPLVGN
jgi:hypothetical protein